MIKERWRKNEDEEEAEKKGKKEENDDNESAGVLFAVEWRLELPVLGR